MSTHTVASPLLTPDEAAEWLRSKERTLERWRSDGVGPAFVRLGRRVAYRLEDLQAWVERQTRQHNRASVGQAPEWSGNTVG